MGRYRHWRVVLAAWVLATVFLLPGSWTALQAQVGPAVFDVRAVAAKNPIKAGEELRVDVITSGPLANTRVIQINGVRKHYHATYDEYVSVVRGRARVVLGSVTRNVGPGGFVLIPRNVHHKVTKLGREPVLVLVVATPASDPKDVTYLEK